MPDHPTRDDIDLISGEFWGRNPHEAFAWMRANAVLAGSSNVIRVAPISSSSRSISRRSGYTRPFTMAGFFAPRSRSSTPSRSRSSRSA